MIAETFQESLLAFQIGGYRLPFLVFGTCSLVFASLTFSLLPDEHGRGIAFDDVLEEKKPTKLKMTDLLRDHRVVFDLIAVIVCCLIIGFNTSTLALWIEQFDLSISTSSLIFLTYGVVYGTSSFLNGLISNRLVSKWISKASSDELIQDRKIWRRIV